MEDGNRSCGQLPAMYGHMAYSPRMSPSSPSRFSLSPVARVRFPPPLSPATIRWSGSMPSSPAWACTHLRPDTQSFRPAGNGSTSGTEDGDTQLRKSTIATATPWLAMSRPHDRYMPR